MLWFGGHVQYPSVGTGGTTARAQGCQHRTSQARCNRNRKHRLHHATCLGHQHSGRAYGRIAGLGHGRARAGSACWVGEKRSFGAVTRPGAKMLFHWRLIDSAEGHHGEEAQEVESEKIEKIEEIEDRETRLGAQEKGSEESGEKDEGKEDDRPKQGGGSSFRIN